MSMTIAVDNLSKLKKFLRSENCNRTNIVFFYYFNQGWKPDYNRRSLTIQTLSSVAILLSAFGTPAQLKKYCKHLVITFSDFLCGCISEI